MEQEGSSPNFKKNLPAAHIMSQTIAVHATIPILEDPF
jgi:hypothetical protein